MHIKPHSLHFFNRGASCLQPDIWSELKNGLWRDLSIKNHLANSRIPANQPHKALDVLERFVVIPPGTYYDTEFGELREELYSPKYIRTDKEGLYALFECYFSQFNGRRIAVHLSGGLDSSIIIGLLHHFNIPFYLVGLASHRFEFRTEKAVQEKLAPLALDSVLIDMEEHPSFGNLLAMPLLQLPLGAGQGFGASQAVAKKCKELGADVVFTGQGGDTVFADAIPCPPDTWNCNIGSEFIFFFDSETLYPAHGLELVAPFADERIIQAIYSLRVGQKRDHLKKWARGFFADVLPRELVEYTYCADFFGTSMSGLELARPEIRQLFRTAHEVTGHRIFSERETDKFLAADVFSFEYQDYIDYCNVISLAAWYNGLDREGYVK